ncbi:MULTISPECIES: DNA topoisomerase IV subunit B [unclassified Holdemanella]|uniref:DNA topoisomerase IV subunit B n=1 Tax=unclassified Holdemanella TaxID=2633909 RepID=UPI001D0BBE01|nr:MULTISPECIES: DNA topoisomerase IV subunit B [unclassified Holdemanella]MCB8641449.1 DNA topoisomerase IV subunit B [Holdemanella sp. DFI.5.55]MCG5649802.1 DNA topoisomerase IV subunit B [Holdemanella sp. DFI.5.21]
MPKQQYDESSIVILEGLDAVRKRPGMYIGSTDSKGLHHLVWEIVDNAIDEALNGYGDEITIILEKDGSVTVEDHGRGMPVGKHKSGVSTLQVIFTILHAGGKFTSHGGYTSAGGLHGVGASVVNALCTWCKVMVHDGKDVWSMTFENGGSKIGKLEKVGKTNHTGSIVSFKPDPSIFKSVHFSYSTICERAQEDAFLLKGLKMIVRDKRKEEREVVYQYEDGLKAFIEEVNQDHTPMHDPISFRGESNQIIVEGCFQYTDEYQENIFSFTNMVRTRDGGSHETGAKQAFTKVFNEYARKNGFLKEKDKGFEGNDVREGLTLVINLTIPEDYLQFEGQTKEKLGTPEAKPATETVVSENLRYFLEENKEVANALVRKIIKAAQARNAARKARADIRNGKGKNRSERVLSGKLASAQSKDARRKELYLVEGDSAGGSAKQGRDSKYQAILPLRGKVLNTEKASLEAIEKNEELNTIIHALGAGVGANFTAEDSNYYKVIIMTDADDDGAHIQNLLLTFFYRYMRDLITHEMLYIALPPLYRIAKAGKEYYLYTNEELDEKKNELKNGYTITRYKGLGEMNATQLWDTTMNPESRTLLCVTIENAMMAEKRVNELMGDKAELRRNWIEDNVVFTLEDDYKTNY